MPVFILSRPLKGLQRGILFRSRGDVGLEMGLVNRSPDVGGRGRGREEGWL